MLKIEKNSAGQIIDMIGKPNIIEDKDGIKRAESGHKYTVRLKNGDMLIIWQEGDVVFKEGDRVVVGLTIKEPFKLETKHKLRKKADVDNTLEDEEIE